MNTLVQPLEGSGLFTVHDRDFLLELRHFLLPGARDTLAPALVFTPATDEVPSRVVFVVARVPPAPVPVPAPAPPLTEELVAVVDTAILDGFDDCVGDF